MKTSTSRPWIIFPAASTLDLCKPLPLSTRLIVFVKEPVAILVASTTRPSLALICIWSGRTRLASSLWTYTLLNTLHHLSAAWNPLATVSTVAMLTTKYIEPICCRRAIRDLILPDSDDCWLKTIADRDAPVSFKNQHWFPTTCDPIDAKFIRLLARGGTLANAMIFTWCDDVQIAWEKALSNSFRSSICENLRRPL